MVKQQIVMIVGDYVEDYEAMVPFQALEMIGHQVSVISPGKKKGQKVVTAVHDFLPGEQTYTELKGHNFQITADFDEVLNHLDQYGALVLPGGRAPEHLRLNDHVLKIVQHFVDSNKPIASICHGPLILTAIPGAIKGKKIAAYFACKHDIINAGAEWVDCKADGAVVSGNIVTGVAWPGHPEWLRAFVQLLGTKIEL
ncbi:hypothetical protein FDP41_008359 [Naegleria fowleri]|uniref:DJ-1/PfpI domain-containing protein n=1 Tax=Naegleria fowleri TaxID=5763 RepID=A0A6A5BE95_NAEFO|nr:uncharacterized protein FDP41_008359 [Naegleria fowleri]KAF0973152.1 hypothetical protein FDP41_008359 [Naegleria fowleri]CAG4719756.1 unnamed protein product [Naegleria fowleri]